MPTKQRGGGGGGGGARVRESLRDGDQSKMRLRTGGAGDRKKIRSKAKGSRRGGEVVGEAMSLGSAMQRNMGYGSS